MLLKRLAALGTRGTGPAAQRWEGLVFSGALRLRCLRTGMCRGGSVGGESEEDGAAVGLAGAEFRGGEGRVVGRIGQVLALYGHAVVVAVGTAGLAYG